MKNLEDKTALNEIDESQFIAALPQSIAEIFTPNNNVAILRIATIFDVVDLMDFITPSDQLKDQIQDWSLITLYFWDSDTHQIFLLGDKSNGSGPVITSSIKSLDIERKLAITSSGALYGLGIPRSGEPSPLQLMLLCITIHSIGAGNWMGVPVYRKSWVR
jgi:hypothetical protein